MDNIKKGAKLSVVSAYFTIYAYYELKKEFDTIDNLRFIFTEPIFSKSKEKDVREYYIDNIRRKDIFGNEFELKLRNEMTQSSIAKECSNWIKKKVEVRSFKSNNTSQPRMIHVENGDGSSLCINGTFDFTTDGLGITPSNRMDNSTATYDEDFNTGFLKVFNDKWENELELIDVKKQLLEEMEIIYKENSGAFIYFVTMYHLFKDYLGELNEENIVKERTNFKETQIWKKLYKFQKDAVIGAIDKIERYNGCIIADSVGLGKTFTALAIIKYYELRNDRVLVLVPKRLRDNWTIYAQNDKRNIFIDDRFGYDVLNHTDLSREKGDSDGINLKTINWGNYDLVVIDESHNFRNNPARKNRKTRYEKLMDDIIKSGVKTKVLMLSATPVNNRVRDIKNQIYFITEDKDNALEDVGINSINYTLKMAQKTFNDWSKLDENYRTSNTFVDMMDMNYFKLLDTLTIARSRKHIEKYYNLDEIGRFPERKDPLNEYCNIDREGIFPPIKEIDNEIKRLTLGIYSPIKYLLHDKREGYEIKYDTYIDSGSRLKQIDRETQLVKLIRIGMLKRLKSSIHSFKLTTEKILYKIKVVLEKIEKGDTGYDSDLDINLIDPDDLEFNDMMIGSKQKVLLKDIDLIKWSGDLKLDREKL